MNSNEEVPAWDDVFLNIYLYKHEEWLRLNPEYTQSPYSGIIADLMGQQDFFDQPWAKE